ncbi:MAG: EamA family transporter, partial [Bacteroidota bacterium]
MFTFIVRASLGATKDAFHRVEPLRGSNMLRPELKSYFYLHLSVLLWSFTAILGDLIALTATTLVWWRVALTTVIMMCLPVVWKAAKSTTRRQVMTLSGIGVLVAIHWLCFYGAIKLANASVSLITMATTTLFTAFLEPLIRRESVSRLDILFGVLIIPCIYLTTTGI